MHRGRVRLEWDQTATLIAHILAAATGQQFHPAEFHPLREDELPLFTETELFGDTEP